MANEPEEIRQLKTLISLLLFQVEELAVANSVCHRVLSENASPLLAQIRQEIADSSSHPLRASFQAHKAQVMAAADRGIGADLFEELGSISGLSQQVLERMR